MTTLTPAVDSALSQDTALVAGILKIELPEATICLLDGAGVMAYGGDTYVGRDDVFGSLAAVSDIGDGVGDEAPAISFTLHPADDAAAANLSSPTMQNSAVTLSLVAIDRATGAIIPDPVPLFIGELDQPTLRLRKGVRELEYECVSGMEKLFANVEGIRLADAWHQNVWPGETGLANVSSIIRTVYWGVHAPSGTLFAGAGGFVGGMFDAIGAGRQP